MGKIDMFTSLNKRRGSTSPASHVNNSTSDPKALTANAPESFLTVKQLAQFLNVSLATAYRLTESAQLPSFRIRGTIRLHRDDVETYLAKQRVSWDRK